MKLLSTLTSSGLTEKQAKIYLTCLEIGPSSVYRLAQVSGIPRSTCYEVLDELKRKGFVSSYTKNKTKIYESINPKSISLLLEEKMEHFNRALPELEALGFSAAGLPSVRFYEGTDSMKLIFEEVLEEATELLAFGSADDLMTIMRDYWPGFVKRRAARKIPAKVILYDSPTAKKRQQLGPSQLRTVKLIPKKYQHNAHIFIWKNKIAMLSYKKDLTALVIQSEPLATAQRQMFNYMWDQAK